MGLTPAHPTPLLPNIQGCKEPCCTQGLSLGQGRTGCCCTHYPAHSAAHSWILARSRCGQDLEDAAWMGNQSQGAGGGYTSLPPTMDHLRAHGCSRARFKAWFSASFLCNDPGKKTLFFAQDGNPRRLVLAPIVLRHRNLCGKAVCSQELSPGKDTET